MQLLSQSTEKPRQPSVHLVESEDEQPHRERREQLVPLERSPSGGVIRKHSTSNGTHVPSSTASHLPDSHGDPNPAPGCQVVKVKEEPAECEEEIPPEQAPTHQPELKGRAVIQAMI